MSFVSHVLSYRVLSYRVLSLMCIEVDKMGISFIPSKEKSDTTDTVKRLDAKVIDSMCRATNAEMKHCCEQSRGLSICCRERQAVDLMTAPCNLSFRFPLFARMSPPETNREPSMNAMRAMRAKRKSTSSKAGESVFTMIQEPPAKSRPGYLYALLTGTPLQI